MRKQDKFKKEYYLQRITNKNLRQLFDLKFITAEFQLNDLRFDGLAYDEKTKSFVNQYFK
jgi:trans-2-enoyl-CoA reductase